MRKSNYGLKELLIEDIVSTYEEHNKAKWHTVKLFFSSAVLLDLLVKLRRLYGRPSTRSEIFNDALTAFLPVMPLPKKVCFSDRKKFRMIVKTNRLKKCQTKS